MIMILDIWIQEFSYKRIYFNSNTNEAFLKFESVLGIKKLSNCLKLLRVPSKQN